MRWQYAPDRVRSACRQAERPPYTPWAPPLGAGWDCAAVETPPQAGRGSPRGGRSGGGADSSLASVPGLVTLFKPGRWQRAGGARLGWSAAGDARRASPRLPPAIPSPLCPAIARQARYASCAWSGAGRAATRAFCAAPRLPPPIRSAPAHRRRRARCGWRAPSSCPRRGGASGTTWGVSARRKKEGGGCGRWGSGRRTPGPPARTSGPTACCCTRRSRSPTTSAAGPCPACALHGA